MHRFFADEDSRIRGDEYKHLTRVLRLSAGDRVIVTAASCTTKLVRLSDRSFFDIVRNKFK